MKAALVTRDLSIGYEHKGVATVVASEIGVTLHPGELVCLIGPNGAGKSTLMRTLAGMQQPLSGEVAIDGRNLSSMSLRELSRSLAVVLTEKFDAGLLTARNLVALGRYPYTSWTGRLQAPDWAKVDTALEAVGATALAQRRFASLSDGERQKILIARALAQDPRVLILDEVTAFLDLPRRVETVRMLKSLARSENRAVLLSTHELDLALRSADRIWLLPRGGPLRAGAPEDLVLSGHFGNVFKADGVTFNSERGVFEMRTGNGLSVRVLADGAQHFWTVHALERAGFAVAPENDIAALEVQAFPLNGTSRWRCRIGEQSSEHATLYDLVRYLRISTEAGMGSSDNASNRRPARASVS